MISIDSFNNGNPERLMKMIWDGVVDEYMYSDAGPLEAIKQAIKLGEKKLRSLLQNDENFEETGVGLNITVFSIKNSNLYVGNLGNHGVDLWREDRYIDIAEILNRHNVLAGSAAIENSDILIVMTNDIREEIISLPYSFNSILDIEQKIVQGGLILLSEEEQIAEIGELVEETEDYSSLENNQYIEKKGEQYFDKSESNDTYDSELQNFENDSFSEDVSLIEDRVEESTNSLNNLENFDSSENNQGYDEYEDSNKTEDIKTNSEDRINTISKQGDENIDELVYQPKIHNLGSFGLAGAAQNRGKNVDLVEEEVEDLLELDEDADFKSKIKYYFKKFKKGFIKFTKFVKSKMPFVVNGFSVVFNFIGGVVGKIFKFIASIFSGLGSKLKGFLDEKFGRSPWYRNFSAKLTQTTMPLMRKKNEISGMRIDGYKDIEIRNKRIGIFVAVILVIILVYAGVKVSQGIKEEKDIHDTVVTNIKNFNTYLESAERESKTNVQLASSNLQKAKTELANANKIVRRDEDKKQLSELEAKLLSVEDTAYKRYVVSEASGNIEIFLDTKLVIGDKSSPTDMAYYRSESGTEYILVSDAGEKGIHRISQYDKKVITLSDASGKIVNPKYVEAGVSGVYVFDQTNGVVRSLFDGEGFTDFTSMTGLSTQNLSKDSIGGMAVFTDFDHVYLIDKKQGGILKANQTDSGVFALPIMYVKDASLTQGTDLFADMSIYYTFLGGQGIKRSFGGEVKTMNVTGVYPTGGSLTAGFAWDSIEKKIFAFDSVNKRILVFERPDEDKGLHPNELVLVRQIVYRGDKSDAFDNVKDIGVSFDDQNLFVLDGLRIWKIKL